MAISPSVPNGPYTFLCVWLLVLVLANTTEADNSHEDTDYDTREFQILGCYDVINLDLEPKDSFVLRPSWPFWGSWEGLFDEIHCRYLCGDYVYMGIQTVKEDPVTRFHNERWYIQCTCFNSLTNGIAADQNNCPYFCGDPGWNGPWTPWCISSSATPNHALIFTDSEYELSPRVPTSSFWTSRPSAADHTPSIANTTTYTTAAPILTTSNRANGTMMTSKQEGLTPGSIAGLAVGLLLALMAVVVTALCILNKEVIVRIFKQKAPKAVTVANPQYGLTTDNINVRVVRPAPPLNNMGSVNSGGYEVVDVYAKPNKANKKNFQNPQSFSFSSEGTTFVENSAYSGVTTHGM